MRICIDLFPTQPSYSTSTSSFKWSQLILQLTLSASPISSESRENRRPQKAINKFYVGKEPQDFRNGMSSAAKIPPLFHEAGKKNRGYGAAPLGIQ